MTRVISFAVCLITAISSGAGVGGGGLLTMYLSLSGMAAQTAAQGVNMLCAVSSQAPSSLLNVIRYRPDMRVITFFTFCGAIGGVLGAIMSSYVRDDVLRRICGAVLVILGLIPVVKRIRHV